MPHSSRQRQTDLQAGGRFAPGLTVASRVGQSLPCQLRRSPPLTGGFQREQGNEESARAQGSFSGSSRTASLRRWRKGASRGRGLGMRRSGDGPQAPVNPVTGKRYHGHKRSASWHESAGFHVRRSAMDDVTSRRRDKKWQVRKGEKSTGIFFFKPLEIEDKDAGANWRRPQPHGWWECCVLTRSFMPARSTAYLNTRCHRRTKRRGTRPDAANVILTNSCAVIRIGGDQAFYSPTTDHIQLPPEQRPFVVRQSGRRTALHEACALDCTSPSA